MQDKLELCNELYDLAQIKTSNGSSECKGVLSAMKRMGNKTNSSVEKIELFLGGIVLAMAQEQRKYTRSGHVNFNVNPGQIVTDAQLPQGQGVNEMIQRLGRYILKNPHVISIDFFKQEIGMEFHGPDRHQMVYLFPNLQDKLDEIGNLLNTCKSFFIPEADMNRGIFLTCVQNMAFFALERERQAQKENPNAVNAPTF